MNKRNEERRFEKVMTQAFLLSFFKSADEDTIEVNGFVLLRSFSKQTNQYNVWVRPRPDKIQINP